MGNQLVVVSPVDVSRVDPELTEVEQLGADGRHHFSTFHCLEKLPEVEIRHEFMSPAVDDNRLPNAPAAWFQFERKLFQMHHLIHRVTLALDSEIGAQPSSALTPMTVSSGDIGELLSSARKRLASCVTSLPNYLIAKCDQTLKYVEKAYSSSEADALLKGEHVVAKVFVHPESCSSLVLQRLSDIMNAMIDTCSMVDKARSGGESQCPSSFLFYSGLAKPPSPQCVYLKRPYIAYSLSERLNRRPLLSLNTRLFLAYQLLKSVQLLHEEYGITHGDIKPSNVLVSTTDWLVLVDVAPYKPGFLSVDQLSLFEYFYDADDTRVCCAAPEKFVSFNVSDEEGSRTTRSPVGSGREVDVSTGYSINNLNIEQHTAAMDMFSVGCVLYYIFEEGRIFSLSDVLELRRLGNQPDELLAFVMKRMNEKCKVEFLRADSATTRKEAGNEIFFDTLRRMLCRLLAARPEKRPAPSDLIDEFTPSLFPAYYGYLYGEVLPRLHRKPPDQQLLDLRDNADDIFSFATETAMKRSGLTNIKTSEAVSEILLPVLLSALRSSATQGAVGCGLECLKEKFLPRISLSIQIECVVPHLLSIAQHPEEYNACSRLAAWRLLITIGTSFTHFLVSSSEHQSFESCLSPAAARRIASHASPQVLPDSYLKPYRAVEHAMIFGTLIIPSLVNCLKGTTAYLQDLSVTLELATESAFLFQLASLAAEWQLNYSYGVASLQLRTMKTSAEGERASTDFVSLWSAYVTQRESLRQTGFELLKSLLRSKEPRVCVTSLTQLPEWASFMGTATPEKLMPYLHYFGSQLASDTASTYSMEVKQTFFYHVVALHSVDELSVCAHDAVRASVSLNLREKRGFHFFDSLNRLVSCGLRSGEWPLLCCVCLGVQEVLALLREKITDHHTSTSQLISQLTLRTKEEEAYMGIVKSLVHLLTHCHPAVSYASAGVVSMAAEVCCIQSTLVDLCKAVRPSLVKPVPLRDLQSELFFPDAIRSASTSNDTCEVVQYASLSDSSACRRRVVDFIVPLPLVYGPKHQNVFLPLPGTVSVRTIRRQLESKPPSQSPRLVSQAPTGQLNANNLEARLLESLRPSGTPILTHEVQHHASLRSLFGLKNSRVFYAGTRGVAAIFHWAIADRPKKCAPRRDALLYRSTHSLDLLQDFSLCDPNGDTVNMEYTAAACTTLQPGDRLSSLVSPGRIVLGSSSSMLTVIDAESGKTVHSSPLMDGSTSVTSLTCTHPDVVLYTASNGSLGLLDFRSSLSPVWSTEMSASLGKPTAACGLFNASESAYGAIIGTDLGVCQLLDLRFSLPVRNYVLLQCGNQENFQADVRGVWESCSWGSIDRQRKHWSIGDVVMDPLSFNHTPSAPPSVLVSTTHGATYRLHLVSGEMTEALRPAASSTNSESPGLQKLWSYGLPSMPEKRRSLLSRMYLFSGGADGMVRQWGLNDILTESTLAASEEPFRSSNSLTLEPFPFQSAAYFVQRRRNRPLGGLVEVDGIPNPPLHPSSVTAIGVGMGYEFCLSGLSLCLMTAAGGSVCVWRNSPDPT